ncbi:MAG: hypothetical protein EZS26_003310 [Candidatus Ordinivivax streblomastigis]|uniref:Uncharacterized protein n=1 Tax=Candidatus Ordinivivax streblomastigis TaxID=2540710 RepID=A0A5M8NV73_9BACT|nr:MAG: hypothetical protein EZS26_003310 [Candidatus Ordinivivax streblomastigis]
MLLLTSLIQGCYKEDAITPTVLTSAASKYEFPQGDSPADTIMAEVYEKYGVKCIYKDFTQSDIDRSWLPPGGGGLVSTKCRWRYVNVDVQLLSAATILKEKIFGLLPENMVQAALRSYPYLYVVDEMRYLSNGQLAKIYPTKALDSWTIDLGLNYQQSDNYEMRIFYPVRVMVEVFDYAYAEGAITMPAEFFAGLDRYTLSLTSRNRANNAGPGTPDYTNYWARRGFLPFVSPVGGGVYTSPTQSGSALSASVLSPLSDADREIPQFFLFLCLDTHCWEYFEPGNIFDDCPKLKTRLEMFNNRMKEVYGIDFDAIRAKLYEGATLDTSPDRYRTESDDDDDYSFIYH